MVAGTKHAFRRRVLGISESLITFIDGAGGALSHVEFRLPSECRILGSLVGTLAALGVQILHIQVQPKTDHITHRLRVAQCDGSDVPVARRLEVQHALLALVECALRNVCRPLAKSREAVITVPGPGSNDSVRAENH